MCQAKPGLRCASHARVSYERALERMEAKVREGRAVTASEQQKNLRDIIHYAARGEVVGPEDPLAKTKVGEIFSRPEQLTGAVARLRADSRRDMSNARVLDEMMEEYSLSHLAEVGESRDRVNSLTDRINTNSAILIAMKGSKKPVNGLPTLLKEEIERDVKERDVEISKLNSILAESKLPREEEQVNFRMLAHTYGLFGVKFDTQRYRQNTAFASAGSNKVIVHYHDDQAPAEYVIEYGLPEDRDKAIERLRQPGLLLKDVDPDISQLRKIHDISCTPSDEPLYEKEVSNSIARAKERRDEAARKGYLRLTHSYARALETLERQLMERGSEESVQLARSIRE